MSLPDDPTRPWLPSLGGDGDWLSFFAFPFTSADIAPIGPWFQRFAGGTMSDVRSLLHEEWSDIENPSLKAFANALLAYHPFGVLKSSRRDWGHAAWIVMSQPPPWQGLADAILRRESMEHVLYLPAPTAVPDGVTIDWNNLVMAFFLRFGGLRCSPPFDGGYFFDFPIPIAVEPGDRDRSIGTPWEDAPVLFEDDVGDRLILSASGEVGWWFHDTREIQLKPGGFATVLREIVTPGAGRQWKVRRPSA